MMFVQASLEDGPRLFRDALKAYNDELIGSMSSAFGAFSRPGLAIMNKAAMRRIGPIGHGYRAGTVEAPAAYQSMAYSKGALVLHMLRTILNAMTGGEDAFTGVLRDFVARHRGGSASTADFERVLSERVPADWSWFFDQWVYGTHIPTYDWSYSVERASGGKWTLELEVEQTDVPPGFRSPIPVRADFGGGRSGQLMVIMDQPRKTFSLTLPAKPKKVILNPDFGILAKMRR